MTKLANEKNTNYHWHSIDPSGPWNLTRLLLAKLRQTILGKHHGIFNGKEVKLLLFKSNSTRVST